MFSKAKRFDSLAMKNQPKVSSKRDLEKTGVKVTSISKPAKAISTSSKDFDTQSQCSSTHSIKSFKT
ncbi:jg2710, partial [Pararge aegeria aegeria]